MLILVLVLRLQVLVLIVYLESLKSTLDLLHVEWDVKLLVFSFRATSEVDNATLLKQICVSHNERNVTKFVVVCGK